MSGQVDVGHPTASLDAWTNPTSIAIGVLRSSPGPIWPRCSSQATRSAAELPDLVRAFRTRALGAGAVTGAAAFGALLVLRSDARPLHDGLTSGSGLVAVIVSAVAGLATFALVWTARFEPARATAAVAVGATIVGWWMAARPDLLPGQLTSTRRLPRTRRSPRW